MPKIAKFKELGNLIRSARNNLGRSQLWLATELGIGPQMVSDIERGIKSLPSVRFKLAQDALAITEQQIIDCILESKRATIIRDLRGDTQNARSQD